MRVHIKSIIKELRLLEEPYNKACIQNLPLSMTIKYANLIRLPWRSFQHGVSLHYYDILNRVFIKWEMLTIPFRKTGLEK